MMNVTELKNTLTSAKFAYDTAARPERERERLKNILFTYFDDILAALAAAEEAQAEVAALDKALRETNAELKRAKTPAKAADKANAADKAAD